MLDFAERKLEFIHDVSQISDERDFAQLEEVMRQIRERQERVEKYSKPLKKKFDPEAVKRARGFKGHDKDEIFRLIREINVQEPVELLLAQLTK